MNDELRIIRAGEQDRPTVLSLLSEHLPGTDVARRHAWLYEQNPHGRAVTFLALDPAGVPVGLTSLFPRRVVVDGALRTGAIGGDGYVRPAFRRRGVATALHQACRETMRGAHDRGDPEAVEFMFGAPMPENLEALEQAGTRTITSLRRYTRPRPVDRVFRVLGRLGRRRPARLVDLSGPDRRVAEIWERACMSAGVMPVRDPTHYAWRFGRSPSGAQRPYAVVEGGRTLAVCALERRGRTIAMIDFLAPPDHHTEALRATANATDAELLTTQVNEAGPTTGDLWRAGFFARERRHFQVLAPEGHPAARTLFDPTSWYSTWGDADVDRIL
jgi:GNAT superfamily N-acetyltransferase